MFFRKRLNETELLAFHLTQAALRMFASDVRENSLVTVLSLETRERQCSVHGRILVLSGIFKIAGDVVVQFSCKIGIRELEYRRKQGSTNPDHEQIPLFLSLRIPGSNHAFEREALVIAERTSRGQEWELKVFYDWSGFARVIEDRLL